MSYSIITATETHASKVAAMEAAYIDCPWTLRQVIDEINDPAAIFLVAVDGDKTIGYISGECAADECELSNVAVDIDYRGQGVASALFARLIERCEKRGVKKIYLLVRADNDSAHRLYLGLGFIETGRRNGYYVGGGDAIIMRRDLEDL